jgi:Tol biopolymer transport system component
MKRYYSLVLSLVIILISGCTDCNDELTNVRNGKYFGLVGPGISPMVFAAGLISTNLSERDVTFSPDGKEFYYTLWTGSFGVIVVLSEDEDGWSEPEVLPFSKKYSNIEPFINKDGSKLFFSSTRPKEQNGEEKDYDIWYVERIDSSWGEPVNLGVPINTDANEFYPSVAENGNIYFTAAYDNSIGGEDIWMCELSNGKYLPPENLGEAVNDKTEEFNAFISPDESYIIYSSWGRDDSFGSGDLYISFKNIDNEWLPAINLGERINSPALDFCPYVTRDEKYFFLTSRRLSEDLNNKEFKEYNSLKTMLNSIQNGQNDIYWMSSNFIDSLRKTEY